MQRSNVLKHSSIHDLHTFRESIKSYIALCKVRGIGALFLNAYPFRPYNLILKLTSDKERSRHYKKTLQIEHYLYLIIICLREIIYFLNDCMVKKEDKN